MLDNLTEDEKAIILGRNKQHRLIVDEISRENTSGAIISNRDAKERLEMFEKVVKWQELNGNAHTPDEIETFRVMFKLRWTDEQVERYLKRTMPYNA